jgi:flap endonuclease-1
MGIKNLSQLINDYNLKEEIIKDNFKEKTKIAIDVSIMIYQVVIAIRNSGADLLNQKGEITSHILGLFNKTIKLLQNNIIPVYVFDGRPPNLKENVLSNRKDVRNRSLQKLNTALSSDDRIKYLKRSVFISKKQIAECKELFDLMGIPHITSPEEADSQCAYLVKVGLVDGVLTEDMDILTFGANKIYSNLSSFRKQSYVIHLKEMLKKFELSQDEFIDFCLLLGCDYYEGIKEVESKKLLEIFKNCDKDLSKTYKYFNLKEENIDLDKIENVKKYFKSCPADIKSSQDCELKPIDKEKLVNKLVFDYNLIKRKILHKVEFIEQL